MATNKKSIWYEPKVPKKALSLIKEVIDTNFINDGPLSNQFASIIAENVQRKYATCVPSGSAGLACSLLALNVKPGDLVLLPAFSFIATANAITLIGAIPVFIDIDENNFCIDIEKLKEKLKILKVKNKSPKVVISVEVNGRSPNYPRLINVCKDFGIKLLTDSAESLGSEYKNKKLGSYGDISVISLSPNKVISTGQGGIILTDNKKLFQSIIAIKLNGNHIRGDGGKDTFYRFGFNFKFTDIQAAIGIPQVEELRKRVSNTMNLREVYVKKLQHIAQFPEFTNGNKPLWVDCITNKKTSLIKLLKSKNIAYREFWLPMNSQESYKYLKMEMPVAEKISKNGVWLASNFNLTPSALLRALND